MDYKSYYKGLLETQEAKDAIQELVERISKFTDFDALALAKEVGVRFDGNYFKPLVMFYELISDSEPLETVIEEVKRGSY